MFVDGRYSAANGVSMFVDAQYSAVNCTSTFVDGHYSTKNGTSMFVDAQYSTRNGTSTFIDAHYSKADGAPTFADAPLSFPWIHSAMHKDVILTLRNRLLWGVMKIFDRFLNLDGKGFGYVGDLYLHHAPS